MDFIDEDRVHKVIIDPAITRLRDEVIPELVAGLKNVIDDLDGWTITIKLEKPK